jgi:hypothetical protein
MRIKLTQQKLKFITLTVFTALGLLIIYTSMLLNSSIHNSSGKNSNIFAQNAILQTIYQEPTEIAQVNTDIPTNANGGAVLGADSCASLRVPVDKGADPSRGLHPDCGKGGASLPFTIDLGGGKGSAAQTDSGGTIDVKYSICIHDLCMPKETLATTFNCANKTCPMQVRDGKVYLKRPDIGQYMKVLREDMRAPNQPAIDASLAEQQLADNKTSTENALQATGERVENGKFVASYIPGEDNYTGLGNKISTGTKYYTGGDLSTASTNESAKEIYLQNTAPGIQIAGRSYEKVSNCTQYQPANNIVLDTTNKTSKCYPMHIDQPICEIRVVKVSGATIESCIKAVMDPYEKEMDKYDPNDPNSTKPSAPTSADCKAAVDFQINTTGLLGNSFNTGGTEGGRTTVALNQLQVMYSRTPTDVGKDLDGSLVKETIAPDDSPFRSTMWLTNATVDVTVLQVGSIGMNVPLPLIKTTALWPDATFDATYESQAATLRPNDPDVIPRESYNDAIEKFYADRNYGACTI